MSYEINTEKAPAAIGPYVQGVDYQRSKVLFMSTLLFLYSQ